MSVRDTRITGAATRSREGQKVVVVEDLISTGGSVLEVVDVLREAGAEVLGVASIFTYGMQKGLDRLAAANVINHSLSNFDTLCEVAAEEGYIKPEDIARLKKFRQNPSFAEKRIGMPTKGGNHMLDIQHLTRRYQNKLAVSDLSLTFEKGKTYALLGPNGSGKTTLMKMIAGLTKQTSGEITLDGIPVGPETKKHIAYMPTESYFYSYMSIADAGKYYADFFEDFDERRYEEALQRMELNPKDKIRTLSSGMNAKVRLALTLSRDAQVMMFDEPLNGVDILTRKQVVDEIIRNRENGRTMIISTHLVDELNAYIDVAIFMKNGVLERIGDRAALEEKHGSLTNLYLSIYGGKEEEKHVEAAQV